LKWLSYGIEVHEVKVIFNAIISIQNLIQINQSAQKLHHLRRLNARHFEVIEVTFSVIMSIQNANQIHQSVTTLSGGSFHPLQKFKRLPFWKEATKLSSMA
jgi:hypothetical protein